MVNGLSKPWPQGNADTNDYREGRAVEAFNTTGVCSNDLLELNPAMLTWVPHIGTFIVPQQLVALGDAT